MTLNFIHLRVHSSYSLAEGAIKIDELVKLCKLNQMPAVAITDSNNLFCSLEFSKECSKNGIQPIIGCEVNFDAQLLVENINYSNVKKFDKLMLYAQDDIGYLNLLKLVSYSFINQKDAIPHISLSDLIENNQGLIVLTASYEGTLGRLLASNQASHAEQFLLNLKHIFTDRLYIELTRHNLTMEANIEPRFIALAYKHQIALVATNNVYFSTKEMYEAHDALLCIAAGRYLNEDDRRKLNSHYYFKSCQEMVDLFADIPEAIENTVIIAKRCAVMAEEHSPMLPNFPTEHGNDEEQELRIIAKLGLKQRLVNEVFTEHNNHIELEKTYNERLDFELNVIVNMQFPGYFLIVSDFIKWSKRQNIPVGPGRGSGAGSLVAWSLEITDLDPIRFGLLFERFLNPERISMPDFDIDFCQYRRDEVIEYVKNKYGKDQVAQIITFGKLQARAVIRDVGRVMQLPYGQIDRISKLVPFNAINPVTLAQAIDMEPALKQACVDDENIAKLVDIALQLEGLHRHASTHAAGIVIAGTKLDRLVPLYSDAKSDMVIVQYSMKYAEAAGLVKFDFLGLKTLTVISNACKLITQRSSNIDISKIPLDDRKTFDMLARGSSVGIFQFESPGMRDSLRKMRPDAIEDLIALGALYRPGPMDNIPTYIACKHGLEQPNYLHPKLEDILKETFGVIIYQEQVMSIAKVLAGYTLGAADLLRRAMGKKIKSEMDAQRQMFVDGAVKNGVTKEYASSIFDLVAKFAGYGFNKSHAAAYAIISYQTAYLKANFPIEFLTASMNLEIDDPEKINIFRDEAKISKIELLPPDINLSSAYFSIESDNQIRYGLGAIKNVGLQAMIALENERINHGAFKNIFDFAERVDSKILNKRQLENLIKAGAFDSLSTNRKQLFDSIDLISRYNSNLNQEKLSKQINLLQIQLQPLYQI